MKIPLMVTTTINEDRQVLEIWRNGKKEVVEPPFSPYFLVRKPVGLSVEPSIIEQVTVKPLSTLQSTKAYRYYFPNTAYINQVNKGLKKTSFHEDKINKLFLENRTEFRERIIIDLPDYFTQFPQTENIKPYFFDIETGTKDGFDLGFIISIAYAGADLIIHSKQIPIHYDRDLPYVLESDERELILWFLQSILDNDPDIIAGYYLKDFDFSYIFNRCVQLGINYQKIGRDGTVDFYPDHEKVKINVGGRIIYDIYESVKEDQTLFGIKSRGLKSVAKWMKFSNVIEEDTSSTTDISQKDLKIYNESDVNLTIQLYNVYILNIITQAEMFGIPLNMLIEGSPSFLANVFQGQGLHAAGIVSDGMNRDRHPEIYDRYRADDEKANYQAAYVDIYRTGKIDKLFKVDFKGMYNAIEITVNASPDTTKIIGYEPLTPESEFLMTKEGSHIIYRVPDNVIGKVVVIDVDNSFDGILRTELKRIRQARAEIKAIMKTCSPEERPRLESQQWTLKVAANIPSGYNGQAVCRWGDIAVSILTVGIGRELIKDTIKYIEKKYADNDISHLDLSLMTEEEKKKHIKACVETDTDGVYIDRWVDIDDLNDYLNHRVEVIFGVKNELELELDEYKTGYFIKMKTYIYRTLSDELVIHGAALKSSKQPGCFDKALTQLGEHILSDHPKQTIKELIQHILDIKTYSKHDLILRVNLGKPPSGYDASTLWGKLIRQADLLGIPLKEGSMIEYIKTVDDYQIAKTVTSPQMVDTLYYKSILERLITTFGFAHELKVKDIADMEKDWY